MRIVVTGALGMLGSALCRRLIVEGHEVIATDKNSEDVKLDVVDLDSVASVISQATPDLLFHLAAETDVDLCERQPEHAFMTNMVGTENVCLVCRERDVPLVYVSTAGVFGGEKLEPYVEFDAPNPANVYGRSKLEGERVVQRLLTRYFIFRAGWMVGGWTIDKKFVRKIVDVVRTRGHVRAVNDKYGTPTFTFDFARNVMRVVGTGRYGLFHMANRGACSRYEVAVKVVEYMGLRGKVPVEPVSSAEFPLPAPRARSEILRNYKLELLGLNDMPDWRESLRRYITENVQPPAAGAGGA